MTTKIFLALCVMCLFIGCGKDRNATIDPTTVVRGTMTDERDGRTYNIVTIGSQTWMAEDLGFKTDSGSWCYGEDGYVLYEKGERLKISPTESCVRGGDARYYNWVTAMTACPTGWRLPTNADWTALINAVGSDAGVKLKSTNTGWSGSATDDYGFSARLRGKRRSSSIYAGSTTSGYWWSAAENGVFGPRMWIMGYQSRNVSPRWFGFSKNIGSSVRCIRDD